LTTRGGKLFWVILVPIYWGIAFVLAAGIPNFSGLTSVVAAVCILQFTYSFPPLLALAYWVKRAALRDGEGFDPATGQTVRHDQGMRRVVRGFLAQKPKELAMSVFNIFYILGALALAGMGAYAAIESLINAFAQSRTTSYTCKISI
jgi:hypothetical protein